MHRNDVKLRREDVASRYSKSVETIKNWQRNENLGFPKPVTIGRRTYWLLRDLEAFEAQFHDRYGAKAA